VDDEYEYDHVSKTICNNVRSHVTECKNCQRGLSYDPTEKAIMKTHSIVNEILEMLAYVLLGIFLTFMMGVGGIVNKS
jgi:hypothetical protein